MVEAFNSEIQTKPYIVFEVSTGFTLEIPEEDYKNFTEENLREKKANMFIFKTKPIQANHVELGTFDIAADLIRVVVNGEEIQIDDEI